MNEHVKRPQGAARGAGVPGGTVACLDLRDAAGAVQFYREAFGAVELERTTLGDGRLLHCRLEINGGPLMVRDAFPEHGRPLLPVQGFLLHLNVADVGSWWTRAVEAGAQIVLPVHVAFWGERYGQLRDPFGVTWAIVSP